MWNKEREGKSVKLQVLGLLLDSLKRPSSRKGGDFLWNERQVMEERRNAVKHVLPLNTVAKHYPSTLVKNGSNDEENKGKDVACSLL